MAATRRCRLAAVAVVSAAAAAVVMAASTVAAPPSTGAAVAVAATAAAASAAAPPPPPLGTSASLVDASSTRQDTTATAADASPATPPAGLYFMVDGELRPSLDARPLVHSFGSATDALTVVFVPASAGESITATHFSGLDAGVCTGAAAAVAPLTPTGGLAGGLAASSPGAANMTLTMEFDGRVGVTPFEFSIDTVDVAGGAHTYRCGGSYVVCGLSLVDDATGTVVSGDGGGAGVSLGSYADVLATGTYRLGVRAQACDGAALGGSPASLDGVQVSVRDVAGDEDLRVFPQPDGCPAVADAVADGCSHAFTPDGSALLLRPAAYRVGAGGVVASLVWPAAAVDGEAWEADVAVRLDTTPPPPPVVTALLVDVDAAPLDVYGGELVGVSAFNAPVYGGLVGSCGWALAGATSPLVREACTFGAADQELVFRTAGGPAFSVHNDSQVMCDDVSAVQSAEVANGGGRGLRVAFGDGRLAAAAVANGTGFVAAGTAARAATLAVAVRLDVYTPTRFSASKAGAVAAALAAAAGVATDAVATVDVGASAAAAAAGAAVQTVYVRVAPAAAAAARSAMTDALASGAVARAVRLEPGGLHLEALSVAPGGGASNDAADAVGGLSTLAVGLIAGAVVVALVVVMLAGAAVRAQAVSVAAESDLSSSSGPLGVPAAAVGAGAPDGILRDVYGRSADAPGLAVDESGGHDRRFVRAGSDASSTYSM
ncbi:hypothetical protein I4F81_008389 [Pyropia yezoensis]|uniref:Uncharacterized protein n=1 Tax=Pyropia yezoensis TaxID=2788 RepID=A0ACC3C803_PYRYE|nr:hypothetical protein I4F81_008389 [Neopyropia yezoensis]